MPLNQPSDKPSAPAAAPDSPARPVCTADLAPLARAILPGATYDYIAAGSEDQVTVRDNTAAFARIKLLPPILHGVSTADTATTVLGLPVSLPVLSAPMSCMAMFHREGALAVARAAAAERTVFAHSSGAGHSVEQVAQATDAPWWFQLYVPADRDVTRKLVQRAERAGCKAIIITVDLGERKDADLRNDFSLPKGLLLKMMHDVGHTHLTDELSYDELIAFARQSWHLSLTWEFFDWLRGQTDLPLLIKGVLGPPDALKAVLVGRPCAYGLAVDGEQGVRRVLQILREELTNGMIAAGCPTVAAIKPTLIARDR